MTPELLEGQVHRDPFPKMLPGVVSVPLDQRASTGPFP